MSYPEHVGRQCPTTLALIPLVTGLLLEDCAALGVNLARRAILLHTDHFDWFRPALGSSGERLQSPTSLCRDGLVPSSKSDPRSATDAPNSTGSICLTQKGLSIMGPARTCLKHIPSQSRRSSGSNATGHEPCGKTGRDNALIKKVRARRANA